MQELPKTKGQVMLRGYQINDVERIGETLQTHRSAVYTLPTGGGKTVMFAEIAARIAAQRSSACIMVHRDNLLEQAAEKLKATGTEFSYIAPGRHHFGDKISIASVQTLVRRLGRYAPFDYLIVDEAHHAISASYRKILDYWPDSRVLGVTATPCRLDGRGLGEVFSSLLCGPTIRELTDEGYLTDSITYAAKQLVDLSHARTTAGDYNLGDLREAMDNQEVTGDAVEQYTKICPGAPAIVFCVSVDHAVSVAAEFTRAGYRAASIDGRMPLSVIRARLAGLRDGSLQVLTSCDLISEGFDAPAVVAIISLRPTKSQALYLQQVGRSLRPSVNVDALQDRLSRCAAIAASSKPRSIILDHAGNAFRHGLPDDAREWSLDAKKKSRSEAANNVKQCQQCFAVCRPWATACHACGCVFPVLVNVREINQVDGDLAPVDPAAFRALRRGEERDARSYASLVALGIQRGYANPMKWAYIRWLARGGKPEDAKM